MSLTDTSEVRARAKLYGLVRPGGVGSLPNPPLRCAPVISAGVSDHRFGCLESGTGGFGDKGDTTRGRGDAVMGRNGGNGRNGRI
ncbi:MAG: hypothetical protein SWY16_02290 [Cyanobacteriota bacterium]|nr:hypothetical protein [Cyanobacteriota bacterium]